MKVFVGVDLGSTTTKAVVMTEDEGILGRGITNSRSNYDVACAIARQEAVAMARFALLGRAIEADRSLARVASAILEDLERLFRREQHLRQLGTLRAACVDTAERHERGVLEEK